ncbi:MAG: SIR2 family protein [Candidatus Omnitrophica bacterium]|nr:SIR2 family protein [Candidatus Omnitrophota bacterium]
MSEQINIKFLPANQTLWLDLMTENDDEEQKNKCDQNKKYLNEMLLSSMQMQNIMVLAGCGTSLGEVGGPSMKDLWNLCTKELKKSKMDYSDAAKNVSKITGYNISDENKVNIEEMLSLCEAYVQINNNNNDINNFIEHCKTKILEACSFETTEEALDGHRTFIHRLSRRRVRDSRLKIFTTNYDNCFEKSAGHQGLVVINGFSFASPRVYDSRYFDYDIIRRDSKADNITNYLEGVFHLYKLHGSVNWERNIDDKIEEKKATPKGVCMIFPARGKYQQSYIQPHLELMARYLSSLRDPNTCLLVCGFGFNDNHFAEPIISAIETNPYLKVIIVDKDAEKMLNHKSTGRVNQYWNKLKVMSTNGENVWFINATFTAFSKLIPDLRSLTPAEKIVHNIKNIVREND